MRWKAGLAMGLALLAAAAAGAQPLGSAGPVTVQPDGAEELQWAAGVSQVHGLTHQGDASVTVFGLTGGDPAMNGEYIYLSFNGPPAEGSRIFKVGDVLGFRILSDRPGRLLLAMRESVMNDNGEIGSASRRVLVTWTPGADGAPPASVTVRTAPAGAR